MPLISWQVWGGRISSENTGGSSPALEQPPDILATAAAKGGTACSRRSDYPSWEGPTGITEPNSLCEAEQIPSAQAVDPGRKTPRPVSHGDGASRVGIQANPPRLVPLG
ncbi:hypothetical protein DV515_00020032 [Chloebia gouldiae]|uniref:Uncharacterized protein n=1 Tax=Chloebia gouldiae TaxID=44316 RepID=A0A3L8Q2N6_CHLGU|nr:hypothetical protein DV515_00020031 [Chloebia gouldiae]RLV61795.1 hypothetical protein DV515_00020032 [Chloebia gouldiae]